MTKPQEPAGGLYVAQCPVCGSRDDYTEPHPRIHTCGHVVPQPAVPAALIAEFTELVAANRRLLAAEHSHSPFDAPFEDYFANADISRPPDALAREAFAAGALWSQEDAQARSVCYDPWHRDDAAELRGAYRAGIENERERLRERAYACQVAVQLPHVGEGTAAVLMSDLRAIFGDAAGSP